MIDSYVGHCSCRILNGSRDSFNLHVLQEDMAMREAMEAKNSLETYTYSLKSTSADHKAAAMIDADDLEVCVISSMQHTATHCNTLHTVAHYDTPSLMLPVRGACAYVCSIRVCVCIHVHTYTGKNIQV